MHAIIPGIMQITSGGMCDSNARNFLHLATYKKKVLILMKKKKSMCDEWFKIIVTEKGRLPIETILMTLQITCQLRR